MTSSATSAKATTSARRMTGGSSLLLSGSGVPTGSLGSARSLGRTRNCLSPRNARMWLESRSRALRTGLRPPQPAHHAKVPSRKREAPLLDSARLVSSRMEPRSLGRVCCAEHQRDAHHRMGQIMAQKFAGNRRQSLARDQRADLRRGFVAGARNSLQRGERAGSRLRLRAAKLVSVRQYDARADRARADG